MIPATPDGWMKQVYDPKYDWSFRTTPQARALSTTTPDGTAEESFYWARYVTPTLLIQGCGC